MEVLLEIIRSLGNAIARHVFNNKQVEEDSILSDALGGALFLLLAIVLFLVLVNVAD
jgi:hypothetical protein